MLDQDHVFEAMAGAQAAEVLVEDDVHDPQHRRFSTPRWARTKVCASRGGRGQVIASGERGSAGGLHHRLDPGDGCEAREARLAGRGPIRPQPTSRLTAGLDAAVIGVHRLAAVGGGVQALEAKLALL